MKRKLLFEVLAAVHLAVGLILVKNTQLEMTGQITGTGTPFGTSFFALAFVLTGLLFVGLAGYAGRQDDYYNRRAAEILKYPGDSFVCSSEIDGLVESLEKKGYSVGHGRGNLAKHIGGIGPSRKHLDIEKSDSSKPGVGKKHLLVTDDPYDTPMKVGYRDNGNRLEKILSKTYHPRHPRGKHRMKTVNVN